MKDYNDDIWESEEEKREWEEWFRQQQEKSDREAYIIVFIMYAIIFLLSWMLKST